MNILEHHGIKGMKWGVRRYQNKDGTLTSAGKARQRVLKTQTDVQSIVDSLTPYERELLGGKPGTEYLPTEEIEDVMKRFVTRIGDTPVAFLDIYKTSTDAGTIALATRSDKEYRSKGYASKLVQQAQNWLETPEAKEAMRVSTLNWFAKRENIPSINLAKKHGFVERSDYKTDQEWYGARYKRKTK